MAENLSNVFSTTLASAATAGATTITVASASGAPAVNFRIRIDDEFMLVTSKGSGTDWTVTRGIESSVAAAHAVNAVVTHVLTAGGLAQYVADALSVYQPLDDDLTAVAALSTTGYLKRTGAATWALVAAVAWVDLSGIPTTLAGYGITDVYDKTVADARFAPIAVPWASITGTPVTLGGYGIGDAYTKTAADARYQPLNSDLTALSGFGLSTGYAKRTASTPTWTLNATVPWGDLSSVPTTVAGYGITDVYDKTTSDGRFLGISAQAADSAKLLGATWASPGTIGSTTPAAITGTTVTANTSVTTPILIGSSNIIEQRNSTNAQKFRIYTTFTDTSNYERAAINTAAGNVTIAGESAGTGSANIDVVLTPKGTGMIRGNASLALNTSSNLFMGIGRAVSWSTTADTYNANCAFLSVAGNQLQINATGGLYLNSGAGRMILSQTTDDGANPLQVTGAFAFYASITNASNYTRGKLSASTSAVTLAGESAGTGSADIDVVLTPKGAGGVKFGTHAAITAETLTGYITIKDSGGTSRKLAVVS